MKTGVSRLLLVFGMLLFALQGAIHPLFHAVGHECSGHHHECNDGANAVPEFSDAAPVALDCPTCGSFCFQADLPTIHSLRLPNLPFFAPPQPSEGRCTTLLRSHNARAPPASL